MRLNLTVGRLACAHQWVDYCHTHERCVACGTMRPLGCDCDDCRLSWEQWRRQQRRRLAELGCLREEWV